MRWTLLAAVSLISAHAFAQTGPATRPATQPAVVPADQLLSRMLKPQGSGAKPLQPSAQVATDRTSGPGATAPNAPAVHLMKEGDKVVDRTGRLTPSPDGQRMEFTFESDGRALRDPPMVLIPNLSLMAMENAVASSSRDLRFRVTGTVTEYKGRNYLLLEKVIVVADSSQPF